MALTQNTIDLQTLLTAVQNLPEPEPAPEFTENGTYTAPSGTAWNEVNINVPVPEVGEKTISENGTYTADTGTAWDTVQVQVPQTEIDTLNVTEKKTYTAPEGHAYGVVNVGIPFWSGEIEVVIEMPNKGDLISMDLGNGSKQYRVLKINGTVAEVLGTYDFTKEATN